jgi:hypothetical protein
VEEPPLVPEVPDDPDDEVEGAEGVLVLLVLVDGVLELLAGDEVLEESPFLVLEYRSEYQPPPFS